MNKTINIINNIIKPALEDISKFLKRDFFELRYLKDETKLKSYFERTKIKNLDRIMHELLKYNPTYGIIHENKIIVESSIKLYWNIKIIDDFANYVNFIPFWGVYVGLISMEDKKLQIATYYMPMQEEFFIAYENEGCFLGNRKLNLLNSRKNYIQSMNSSINNRIFGSDILTTFYVACERINIAELKNTSENRSLANLIIVESKGKIVLSDNAIKIASPNLI